MPEEILEEKEGISHLLRGNDAISRGALEAGVRVVSGYPGTPSTEIVENLSKVAKERNVYVEWSINEKVAMEVAAAASFANLRSMCVMKQNGVNVGSDFLLHLSHSGVRGGMVIVTCDDPGALSSATEGESRHFAKLLELPLLEPGNFQEAKDMTKWAFELSEKVRSVVLLRSVTRLSHASGNLKFGSLSSLNRSAEFKCHGPLLDPKEGPIFSTPPVYKHNLQQKKINKVRSIFEQSSFNNYEGPPTPQLLIVTSSAAYLYSKEAIQLLELGGKVGLLKLGTTWPLPINFLKKYFTITKRIMIVEEVLPFLEESVKVLATDLSKEIGMKTFYGKNEEYFPMSGELNPDIIIGVLKKVFCIEYKTISLRSSEHAEKQNHLEEVPIREQTFCPGCPHRASFWSIHNALQRDNRKGFVCGDIGCYFMGGLPCGFNNNKTGHAMGSGAGIASGFGKLEQFGMKQPILAVCGDSTFFHSVIPALINAVHHNSNMTMIILDNHGTAMTGFQSHPGLNSNATGDWTPNVDLVKLCQTITKKTIIKDPFDLEGTEQTLIKFMADEDGVKILILQASCALSPEKKNKKKYKMNFSKSICLGENCGCNRLCTRIFRCPGLRWDNQNKKAGIDEVLCTGCGACADICPVGAITKEKEA